MAYKQRTVNTISSTNMGTQCATQHHPFHYNQRDREKSAKKIGLDILRFIYRVACCEAPVLLQGETGTGKELAASAIHYLSARRNGPFIPVNCGAIPDTLIESELFGHVRGAFTDAKEPRQGVVGQARGGTLFLDELEVISHRGQVALLRFLQDQRYCPIGGAAAKKGDVRVIGASNTDLAKLAARGEFRQDLLFRLNVLIGEVPALIEHPSSSVS